MGKHHLPELKDLNIRQRPWYHYVDYFESDYPENRGSHRFDEIFVGANCLDKLFVNSNGEVVKYLGFNEGFIKYSAS